MESIVAGAAVKSLLDLTRSRIEKRFDMKTADPSKVYDRLEAHLMEVVRWSSRVQFFGMAAAEDTETATIDLTITTQPRRFRGQQSGQEMKEPDLLADSQHYLLLGDPGAGKTTILKRLVQRVIFEPPQNDEDIYRCPVVIRLREMEPGTLFLDGLGAIVGAPDELLPRTRSHEHKYEPLVDFLAEFLNEHNAALFIDGLDEVVEEDRVKIEKQISMLGHQLYASKMIVTTRSGDYRRHLDGFNTVELCPLTSEQISEIAGLWLTDPAAFLKALQGLPYADMGDRPLLLAQLIVLFRRDGQLPEQPSFVYRRLLRLLLEEWDHERGIQRRSRYSSFDPDRKAEFLAALAYHFTYTIQTKTFSEQDLISAYARLWRRFNLPASESILVAQEIESHTGMIVRGSNHFEFSHLSFQEYLCASHLVREPFSEHMDQYLTTYPEPLAVAVAIAANASNWLAGLILKPRNYSALRSGQLGRFLTRLAAEHPYFETSTYLGIAFLRLCGDAVQLGIESTLGPFLEDDAVLDSISIALPYYKLVPAERTTESLVFAKVAEAKNQFGFETPGLGYLPKGVVGLIWKRDQSRIVVENSQGSFRGITEQEMRALTE